MNAISRIGTSVIAGVMLLAGGGVAVAHDSLSAEEAQAKADAARARAAEYAAQGGWAYKSGTVQRALRDAERYQAEADAARPYVCMPADSMMMGLHWRVLTPYSSKPVEPTLRTYR